MNATPAAAGVRRRARTLPRARRRRRVPRVRRPLPPLQARLEPAGRDLLALRRARAPPRGRAAVARAARSCSTAPRASCTSRPSGASASTRTGSASATSPPTSTRRKGDLQLDIRALDLPDASFDAIDLQPRARARRPRPRRAAPSCAGSSRPDGWVLLMVPQDLERARDLRGPVDHHAGRAPRRLLAARPRPALRARLRRPRSPRPASPSR